MNDMDARNLPRLRVGEQPRCTCEDLVKYKHKCPVHDAEFFEAIRNVVDGKFKEMSFQNAKAMFIEKIDKAIKRPTVDWESDLSANEISFRKQFKKECPETVGEKDSHFDDSNYIDWLEKKLVQFIEPDL